MYIIGTAFCILRFIFTGPVFNEPDYLSQVYTNPNKIVMGVLFVLTKSLATEMGSVITFPILKGYNEVLTLGYVVFRGALEAFIYLVLVIGWLSLHLLSQG